ncbi:MAG: hypothetical protein VKL42_08815 [Snowella sp.]|nr:hypothetical protein [Snowella sp.]
MAKVQEQPQVQFVFTEIPTKSQRAASQLRDGLRILKWIKFRQDNKANIPAGKEGGFAAYAAFEAEWKNHPCHGMDLEALKGYITETLGYPLTELNEIRSKYYESKKGYSVKAAITPTENNGEDFGDEIPY